MIVSATQPPPATVELLNHDHWERGLDPCHEDAYPEGWKVLGKKGPRAFGWFAVDSDGNTIMWIQDGTVIGNG